MYQVDFIILVNSILNFFNIYVYIYIYMYVHVLKESTYKFSPKALKSQERPAWLGLTTNIATRLYGLDGNE